MGCVVLVLYGLGVADGSFIPQLVEAFRTRVYFTKSTESLSAANYSQQWNRITFDFK